MKKHMMHYVITLINMIDMAGAGYEVIKIRTIPMYSTTGNSQPVGTITIKTIIRR
jgi:hypothetical protein